MVFFGGGPLAIARRGSLQKYGSFERKYFYNIFYKKPI